MKRRILLSCISVIGCLLLITTLEVYANGVSPPGPKKGPYQTIILILNMFILGWGIEFLVFTHKSLDLAERDGRSLVTFLKINLITFPVTQILAYIVYIYANAYYWYYILGIEILVVLAEWRLILLKFEKQYALSLHSRKTLGVTSIANCISFLFGFIPYYFIDITFRIFV